MIAKNIKETMNSKGASVIRKMFEEGRKLKAIHGDDAVFDFSLGNPDLEPPKEVLDAIKDLAQNRQMGDSAYMPNAGLPETRLAIAKKINGEQGISTLTENHVIITVGAAGALVSVFKAILNPGDEVLVSTPFFAEYNHYAKNHGGLLRPVQSREDLSFDLDGFSAAISSKTAAVLINSPNNPSGKIYTRKELEGLCALLEKKSKEIGRTIYLISDEPYRDIVYDGREVSSLFDLYDASIVVSSFAKNLSLPGERLGYIAVNPSMEDASELIAACTFANRILGFVNAPAFFQRVIARSWNAKADFSSYERRKNAITKIVRDAGIDFIEPEGAFYLFCKVPLSKEGSRDDFAFCDHLKKYLILCAPGTGFGSPGYFRISYCVPEKTIMNAAEAFKSARESW
ncbi:MAG TPA: pyridoxal phosphate-dependent aminotransferase [Treponemataceae bacterium]|nr:pyridoxal phosphate-dependent aminotransferase [Treponemataceae bacterium]